MPSSRPPPTPPPLGLPWQHFPRLYGNSIWFQGYNFIQSNHLPNQRPLPKDAIAKELLLKVEPVPLSPRACSYSMSCRVRAEAAPRPGGAESRPCNLHTLAQAQRVHSEACSRSPRADPLSSTPHSFSTYQAAHGSHEQQGFLAASKKGTRGWHPREQKSSSF